MLARARLRAKAEGVPFSLTEADITIPKHCPVLGLRLSRKVGRQGGSDCSPSLDRMDPRAGYVPGNVTVVSNKANRIKSQLSPDQLVLFARAYYHHYLEVKGDT